jgi:ParB family chromosome partitioning protein
MNQPAAFAGETIVRMLPLNWIAPDEKQVRRIFDEEDLQQLADSIREHGVIQPIVVRPPELSDGEEVSTLRPYELIAGERRWRASQLAGRETIPAVIRADLVGQDVSVLQILENLQRADLSLQETAAGVSALVAKVGNAQAAAQLGKSEGWVSKHARIGELPETVRELIEVGHVISADIAHDMAQLVELSGGDDWRVKNVLNQASAGTLTRASVRETLRHAKETAEQAATRKREREEREARERELANDPSHQAKLKKLQEEERQRLAAIDRATKNREKRRARIGELQAAIEPRLQRWAETLSKGLNLPVERDEDTGEIITDCDVYYFDSPLVVTPEDMSQHDDAQTLPATADDVQIILQIRLSQAQLQEVIATLVGDADAEAEPAEKQGDIDVGTFIEECLDRSDPNAREKSSDVYAAYRQRCDERGVTPLPSTSNAWGDAIAAAGIQKIRSNGIRYVGVRLI